MIALVACAVLFTWAVIATAFIIVARAQLSGRLVAKQAEIDALKKVGGWYETRVADLEHETRQLASQIVANGLPAFHAMPLQAPEAEHEYAYDPTGLVRDVLDPRDMPVS